MLFCDWYLKNERIEMKGKDAKEMKAKKKAWPKPC